MSFFEELKRRNVFRVGIAYAIGGWLVLQLTDVLSQLLALPEIVGRVVVLVVAIGLPITLFLAWAFEMTPDGIKKEKDVDRSQSITKVTGQKLNNAIIGILVVALVYFAVDKFMLDPGRDAKEIASAIEGSQEQIAEQANTHKTIAVLPFVNMSEDSSNEYFSDGLTEELLNILAKIKELRVAGRTSSFAFKDQHDDLRLIGNKLNVQTILEGSVRKDEQRNRVRITAQLVSVEDGFHLWSETYDRELDDIFAIQEEIAREVAQAMRITLLGEDEVRLEHIASTEISAYDIYLKALQNLRENSFESLGTAVKQFQQTLELDPTFTPAKVGLVKSWSHMGLTGAITRQESVNRGMPILEAVIEVEPENSDAHVQMALLLTFQNDNQAAENEYITALDIEPRNAYSLMSFGRFLFNNGQVERGIALIDAALEIEPYSVVVLWQQCQTNAFLQNLDKAQRACSRIKEIAPESPLGWYGEALAYTHTGDLVRATKGLSDAIGKDPNDFEMISAVGGYWVDLGDTNQAEKWLRQADNVGAGQAFPLRARLNLYQYREQHDLAHELVKQVLERQLEDRHGTSFNFRQIWAYQSALKGDYQAGLDPYREVFDWAFQTPLETPDLVQLQLADILQIAALLKLAEPMSSRPEELLGIVEAHIGEEAPGWGIWAADLSKAAVATIRGQNENALQLLNNARDKNWRVTWRNILLYDVVFSQLASEPGYQELIERFETDMERQRVLAYELMDVKNPIGGDNE